MPILSPLIPGMGPVVATVMAFGFSLPHPSVGLRPPERVSRPPLPPSYSHDEAYHPPLRLTTCTKV
jgi:hypothetical protein